jgi:acetyltransferase-like isoleucine patch superfamily enzyme
MYFISGLLRFIGRQLAALLNFFRILRLRSLYPGLSVDFKTIIEKNCSIVCIKGGKLEILRSTISAGTQIVADEKAELKISGSFIGRNCVITAKEKVVIAEGCLVAEMVVIRDQDHLVDIGTDGTDREKFQTASIEIGPQAWIAAKATVLKGVTIGEYAVLAASAVATKPIPAWEVWGGTPAKFIRPVAGNHTTTLSKA